MADHNARATAALVIIVAALAGTGCKRAPSTIEDWNSALTSVIELSSEEQLPDGSTISEACVRVQKGEPCVPVSIHREPFEQLRVVRPKGQVDQLTGRPRLLPYIQIRDGDYPHLSIAAEYPLLNGSRVSPLFNQPRIAIVVDGDLVYETRRYGMGGARHTLFNPNAEQWRLLQGIRPGSQVQARLYYTPGQSFEKTLLVGAEDSSRFTSEFHAMVRAYNALDRALDPRTLFHRGEPPTTTILEPDDSANSDLSKSDARNPE